MPPANLFRVTAGGISPGGKIRTLNVGLTAEERAARRHSLGGSDANIIASGDAEAIHWLWLEKTGQCEPKDLSGSLPVMMGSWTEELNRYWFELQTGMEVTSENTKIHHAATGWLTATLDGKTNLMPGDQPAIFEAKHVGAFNFNARETLQRYNPQLHHNMFVADVEHAVLSVFVGTQRWIYFPVEFDPFYHADLLDAERDFWRSVTTGTPPGNLPDVVMPLTEEQAVIDMTGNNLWADAAVEYLETRDGYRRNQRASKALRELVPKSAMVITGHGIVAARDKRGSLRISEQGRDHEYDGSD